MHSFSRQNLEAKGPIHLHGLFKRHRRKYSLAESINKACQCRDLIVMSEKNACKNYAEVGV